MRLDGSDGSFIEAYMIRFTTVFYEAFGLEVVHGKLYMAASAFGINVKLGNARVDSQDFMFYAFDW